MKTLSPKKLLMMLVNKEHVSSCQRKSFPVVDCLCFMHEFKAYQDRLAEIAKNRANAPKKAKMPRPTKIHFDSFACAKNTNVTVSNDVNDITCKHCLKMVAKSAANIGPLNNNVVTNSISSTISDANQ